MAEIETPNFNVNDYIDDDVKWIPIHDEGGDNSLKIDNLVKANNPDESDRKANKKQLSKPDDGLFVEDMNDYFEDISKSNKNRKVLNINKDLEDSLNGINFSDDDSLTGTHGPFGVVEPIDTIDTIENGETYEIEKIDEVCQRVDEISSVLDDLKDEIEKVNSRQKKIMDMLEKIMAKLDIPIKSKK